MPIDTTTLLKGPAKKCHLSNFDIQFSLLTVGPMSTPSPEKDSLLGPTVHEQLAHQILKKEGFF